ncbi:LysR family transcriptional regulator [Oleiagrimonas soli]|uniref:DNA-binding transcriptional LysR family regulator n=1 Tax=Oleiagrimonas soli TaxID=1543381 RepID=A0A099CV51_9GAMM|nr:LysR family transcriptional regulator [Oleiagrimonas soli]KGI77669.1 LysR family transcriptional regulator [Oleiagrimonas soli]MBB6182807.1 DNA-binding transcriptional LysR family regulator [Oleiagrimonas soli]
MRDDPTAALRNVQLIARYGSFTRAARELDVTPSALSQSLRQLERQLGVRLLHRSTRRVGLTEAGREFLARIAPAMDVIDDAMENARQHGQRPAGTLRLTMANSLMLGRVIPDFMRAYPDITLDLRVETRLVDLIDEGLDAGIRLGERLQKDVVAIPLGGPNRSRVVGSPAYFKQHGTPMHPRELSAHNCARFRFRPDGPIHQWEFAQRGGSHAGRWFEVHVDGNLIVNDNALIVEAARRGTALAQLLEEYVADDLASGRLVSVLDTWLPPYDGWYLYYPSRFQVPPKLRVFIDFVRAKLNGSE